LRARGDPPGLTGVCEIVAVSAFDVTLSDAERDDAWDAFVETAPGGHHVQTSRWGQVKAVLGWRAVRAIVRQDGEIVAGCQLLIRGAGPFGTLAFAPRSPLARQPSTALTCPHRLVWT
jgi:hypothetical protein